MHRRTTENLDVELINQKNETLTIWTALKNKKSKNLSFKLAMPLSKVMQGIANPRSKLAQSH